MTTDSNIPYRGNVDHGVPHEQIESADEAHYWEGRPVEYLPEEKAVDPLPVYVVEGPDAKGKEIKAYNTGRFQIPLVSLGRATVQVAGRDDRRTKIMVKCVGTTNHEDCHMYIGNAQVSRFSGYHMGAGDEVTLVTTEPVFIYAETSDTNTGDDIIVTVLTETSANVR